MFFHVEFHWRDRKRKPERKQVTLEERMKGLQLALVEAQKAGDQAHADELTNEIRNTVELAEWNRRIARERSVGYDRDAPISDANARAFYGF